MLNWNKIRIHDIRSLMEDEYNKKIPKEYRGDGQRVPKFDELGWCHDPSFLDLDDFNSLFHVVFRNKETGYTTQTVTYIWNLPERRYDILAWRIVHELPRKFRGENK